MLLVRNLRLRYFQLSNGWLVGEDSWRQDDAVCPHVYIVMLVKHET